MQTRRSILVLVMLLSVIRQLTGTVLAQSPKKQLDDRAREQIERQTQRLQQQVRDVASDPNELPTDPQLLVLHKEFITKAEKLAMESERKKQLDKAREVYASLVRLVPNSTVGQEGLSRILGSQTVQDRQLCVVHANQAWQDSGVTLSEGIPVHFEVQGNWEVVYETGAKGIEIPDELKPKDHRIKLGTLIATIVTKPADLNEAKPFPVEDGQDFITKSSGRLFFRMFDVDPTDNEGKLAVLVQSTFGK